MMASEPTFCIRPSIVRSILKDEMGGGGGLDENLCEVTRGHYSDIFVAPQEVEYENLSRAFNGTLHLKLPHGKI